MHLSFGNESDVARSCMMKLSRDLDIKRPIKNKKQLVLCVMDVARRPDIGQHNARAKTY